MLYTIQQNAVAIIFAAIVLLDLISIMYAKKVSDDDENFYQ